MKFTTKSSGGTVEILAANQFTAIPMTITGTSVVKAGTPITSAGAAGTAVNAVGVLLYDVDPSINPNAAVVVQGVIDATKAESHSGISLTGIEAQVPGIILRTNIGVNE